MIKFLPGSHHLQKPDGLQRAMELCPWPKGGLWNICIIRAKIFWGSSDGLFKARYITKRYVIKKNFFDFKFFGNFFKMTALLLKNMVSIRNFLPLRFSKMGEEIVFGLLSQCAFWSDSAKCQQCQWSIFQNELSKYFALNLIYCICSLKKCLK